MSEIRTIPPALTKDEWNALLDHALEKAADYILRQKDGAYEAINGSTGKKDYTEAGLKAATQAIIDVLGVKGGKILMKKGTHVAEGSIVPFPGASDGEGTLIIQGEGMFNTILKADPNFNTWGGYTGLIGYGKSGIGNFKPHQVILLDLTLDGNYNGVDAGQVPQPPSAAPALWSLPAPFVDPDVPEAPSGFCHIMNRVRLYRTPGYGLQPANSVEMIACLFDRCGQPDKVALNYDIVGGGDWAYLKMYDCEYKGSRGNYADFSASTIGRPCKIIMIGNVAYDHISGGLYALGERSVIEGNVLLNQNAGSGIGYDAMTHANNRIASSIVADNILQNLEVDQWATIKTRGNVGWVTENSGVATILSGQSSVVFAHGLSGALVPNVVSLGAKHAEVADAIWSADATNITITLPGNVTANRDISWSAEYKP